MRWASFRRQNETLALIWRRITTINLSIKDVPDDIAERLRARAARNHRSLQGELMAIVEMAAAQTAVAPSGRPAGVSAARARGGKAIEDIAAEHRARFPKPITRGPMAVDIIRADRDTR